MRKNEGWVEWIGKDGLELKGVSFLFYMYYVIYTERESVLYHGIKTPRSVLRNEAVGRVF